MRESIIIISYLSLGWTREWSDEHQVPYAYSGSDWVGYDDTESIALKVRHLVFARNIIDEADWNRLNMSMK